MTFVFTGGRDYKDMGMVDEIIRRLKPKQIHVGDCPTGADRYVRVVAEKKNIPITVHRADWEANGKAAGPIRNRDMLADAGLDATVVAFKGGRGTENCVSLAVQSNMIVLRVEP